MLLLFKEHLSTLFSSLLLAKKSFSVFPCSLTLALKIESMARRRSTELGVWKLQFSLNLFI